MPQVSAFAPGRVNLIGEHTDYNDGLSLPFALAQGVTVTAETCAGEGLRWPAGTGLDAFVRGTAAELQAEGLRLPAARLTVSSDLPQRRGLASSAALTVALALSLRGLAGAPPADPVAVAELCSRVENRWVGAHTGLLDQLASLLGRDGHAVLIDFRALTAGPVPLNLGAWRLVCMDSGQPRSLTATGYNQRRVECAEARRALGLDSLRAATATHADRLPPPLDRRVRHVVDENQRVRDTADALGCQDLDRVGRLLDASHASLRDLYDASTPAVEATVAELRDAGASGARMLGGGFGGSVLALFPPGVSPPAGAFAVSPSPGAHTR